MSDELDLTRCQDGCAELLAKLEAYLDGELASEGRQELEQHIADCFPCADRASLERQLRTLIKTSCVESAPATLRTRILAYVTQDPSTRQ
jgi:mycothiol system anti-sigma-R factor